MNAFRICLVTTFYSDREFLGSFGAKNFWQNRFASRRGVTSEVARALQTSRVAYACQTFVRAQSSIRTPHATMSAPIPHARAPATADETPPPPTDRGPHQSHARGFQSRQYRSFNAP